jgi:hypothetical protein
VRAYLLTLGVGCALLIAAGQYYARLKGVPPPYIWPLLAAFLIEFAFYLVPGFEQMRRLIAGGLPMIPFCSLLTVSAVLPYLAYTLPLGRFQADAFGRLVVLAAALSFWYVFRPATKTADLAALALIGAALLSKMFTRIYTSPSPGLHIEVLGQLMLIRLSAMVMLEVREADRTGFGFLPTAREWRIGLREFLFFVPVGIPVGLAMGVLQFSPSWKEARFLPLVFLASLWVIALSEELWFRGLLQQWLEDWTGRPVTALAATSAIFGLCHLPFRGFPNWRWVVIAGLLGVFCGRAYRDGKSIRASMVTHALVVTTWRAFL